MAALLVGSPTRSARILMPELAGLAVYLLMAVGAAVAPRRHLQEGVRR